MLKPAFIPRDHYSGSTKGGSTTGKGGFVPQAPFLRINMTNLLQIIALVVKLSWTPTIHTPPILPTSTYRVYRAPLVVTSSINEDGLTIATETCGTFSKWGQTTGSYMIDSRALVQGSTYCYEISEITSETVTDLLTGITSTIQVESARSEPIVVTVSTAPIAAPANPLTSASMRASILPQ